MTNEPATPEPVGEDAIRGAAAWPSPPEAAPERPLGDRPEPPIAPDAAMRSLPGARSLVAAGFELLRLSQRDLTRASLYIGLLTLLTVGPAVVLLIYFVTQEPDLFTDFLAFAGSEAPSEPPTSLVLVVLAFFVAVPAFVAISIEAELMAVGILAGRRVGRAVSMEEALRRSRQAFWRIVVASLLIGAASTAILLGLGEVLSPSIMASSELNTFFSVVLGIAFGLPFAYLTTGIVLGDAGPVQTLARSIRLARARPLLALVIAAFTTLVSVINTFALAAGGDTLLRIADFLHLDFQSGPLLTVLSVLVILAGVVAIGSLIFTISAVTTAPQVVAFLGLTHFSGGLDLARLVARPVPRASAVFVAPAGEPGASSVPETGATSSLDALTQVPMPAAPPAAAWAREAEAAAAKEASAIPPLVTWPMFLCAVLAGLCALAGFANLAGL